MIWKITNFLRIFSTEKKFVKNGKKFVKFEFSIYDRRSAIHDEAGLFPILTFHCLINLQLRPIGSHVQNFVFCFAVV